MKIAVLLSGQLRDFENVSENHLKHFIEPNNADIFATISTSNFDYFRDKENPPDVTKWIFKLNYKDNIQDAKQRIETAYDSYIKDLKIIDNESIPENQGTMEYYRYFLRNQFNNNTISFNMAKAWEKEHKIQYDLFVRLRLDKTVFPNLIKIDKFDKNTAYTGHIEPCTFFCVGDKNVMEQYCNFNYLENYIYQEGDNMENFRFPPAPIEILKHMKNNINIRIQPNLCTFYCGESSKGRTLIGNFPYIKNKGKFCWNSQLWLGDD